VTDNNTPRASDVRARYEWRKVEAPKTWRPKAIGEELAGFYGGKTSRNGTFGQYEVVIVHIPRRGSFMISGTRILQLIDTSGIKLGWPIRIVWKGVIALPPPPEDKTMKVFEVYVAEGDPVAPEELPRLKEERASTEPQ
jgi:hypothetical protein